MSKVYYLPEFKIDETDEEMKEIIDSFNQLKNEGKYFEALYKLESLILQDGTNKKYNYIFLEYILNNIKSLIKQIGIYKGLIKKKGINYIKEKAFLKDVKKYNFYYFRNCFDKYEISLDNDQLMDIQIKKMEYNEEIIKKENKSLQKQYREFLDKLKDVKNFVSAEEVYKTINDINEKIKNKNYKLFYLYRYLDCKLIENNTIFKYLEENIFYLNQFYFAEFGNLGIAIGYCDNINLLYRYLFMEIKDKIKENEDKFSEKKDIIKYIFQTFESLLATLKEKKIEFLRYFIFSFVNVIFDIGKNILFSYQFSQIPLYFKIICNQFLSEDTIKNKLLSKFKYNKPKIFPINKKETQIQINNETITFTNNEYSINTFLELYIEDSWMANNEIIKNKSQRFLCKNKIYGDYFDEFINLLKKICTSNVAAIMQSLHEEFKQYESFFANEEILNDLFDNRLKFYPFDQKDVPLYGITDKYLLEIYMSSIFLYNSSGSDAEIFKSQTEIMIIFNMSFHSVIFQHEVLNHYIRAYLSYEYEHEPSKNLRKISIHSKKNHSYYPTQKLDKIKHIPEYLNKFIKEMNSKELDKLKIVSKLNYKQYLEESSENKIKGIDDEVGEEEMEVCEEEEDNMKEEEEDNMKEEEEMKDIKDNRNIDNDNTIDPKNDDEGYYYERQLFVGPKEHKLKSFNFLQALMLIDEDAYNMDPVHFHYCFLKLRDTKKYQLFEKNFKSPLLEKILKKIDFSKKEQIQNLKFVAKRDGKGDMFLFEIERNANDVMPSCLRYKKY